MKIVSFCDIPPADWDRVVSESDDAWLMHRADWVGIESRYFVRSNHSFAVVAGDKLAAIQPLYLSAASEGTPHGERLLHCGIHRHAGLALSPDVPKLHRDEAQAIAIRHVIDTAELLDADRIQLSVQNLAPRSLRADRDMVPFWVSKHGFFLGTGFGPHTIEPAPAYATLAADQIVDLALSEEELFAGVDRKAIRKAEKSGLVFSTDTTLSGLDRYWRLAQISARRTGEELPSRAYYESLIDRLGSQGRAIIYFVGRDYTSDAAALFIIFDKSGASYLAGVSDSQFLEFRPNDYIHWRAMLDLKARGVGHYRLGPIFPEVPEDWPIARVSRFKSKFGGRSYPTIVASRWLNRDYAQQAIGRATAIMSKMVEQIPVTTCESSVNSDLVAHLLRLVGVNASSVVSDRSDEIFVADAGVRHSITVARRAISRGVPVVMLQARFAAVAFDATQGPCVHQPSGMFEALHGNECWRKLRSLHPVSLVNSADASVIVRSQAGEPVWIWIPQGTAGVLMIGTDLAADLLQMRQGNPAAARNRPTEPIWGIAGERPNYLFEEQLDSERPYDRMADFWIWTLRDALVRYAAVKPRDVLPGGAPGAVIITGDDDQAALAKYDEQLKVLGDTPITYLLHPLTRHTPQTLKAMQKRNPGVDFGIHPDALDAPERYSDLFDEQAKWYACLTGGAPVSLRNHGFLNDGYWGHLDAWLKHGVKISSNIPGFDGRVLNGSLLPARLVWQERLSPHWSVLTAVGDGVRFAAGMSDDAAASRIFSVAEEIKRSGLPGVIVLNLHPDNVDRTKAMHLAALEVINSGFVPWNLRQSWEWFCSQDQIQQSPSKLMEPQNGETLKKILRKLRTFSFKIGD